MVYLLCADNFFNVMIFLLYIDIIFYYGLCSAHLLMLHNFAGRGCAEHTPF